jgi:hypothetical protein
MKWLQGRVVRFRLSPEGKQALAGVFEKESLSALIEVIDDLGAWIVTGRPEVGKAYPLMLLKWDYFATAVVEIEPVEETPRQPIGFGR